jgi:hemolysin activation/secretion protein
MQRLRLLGIFLSTITFSLFAEDLKSIVPPNNLKPASPSSSSLQDLPYLSEDQRVLIPELKGIVLIPSSSRGLTKITATHEAIEIQGDLQLPGSKDKLIKRLLPFIDQPVSQKTLQQIKRQIVLYYREEKHPVVMVLIPEQKISNGILQVAVIEACVDRIGISGGHYTDLDRVRREIRLEPGEYIDEARLLQDVSWINMNPYRSASILYSPGEKNGTTDVNIKIDDRRPYRVYVGGDNTGSAYTGEARWFAGINFADALFPNNLFSYQFTTSNNFHKFTSHTLQYVAPLPWRNTLSVFGGYAFVNPSIPNFCTKGKSYQASGRYDIPMWFTYPSHPQQWTLGFDFKGTNNNVIFGQDNKQVVQKSLVNIAQFVFGYHFNVERPLQKFALGLDAFWSPGQMVSHQTLADFRGLNAFATPKYIYGHMTAEHQLIMPKTWTLNSKLRLQLSNSNLLASEQFALGGYNTVRGYRERVVNGDNAVCGNIEIHSPIVHLASRASKKLPNDALFFIAFADAGYAWDHKQQPGLPRSQTLVGVGPGLRYRIGSSLISRFDVGFPLHRVCNTSDSVQIHVSVVGSY